MLRSILMKPEITAEDIRLAEGLRSPFWDDSVKAENDPIIIAAIDLFNKIRRELLSIRTQLSIYGMVLYFLAFMLSITLDLVSEKDVTFLDPFLIFFTIWFALCFIQGWRLFRLVVKKTELSTKWLKILWTDTQSGSMSSRKLIQKNLSRS